MDESKRIIINMDNNRHLTYEVNFKDMGTTLSMIQMVLSALGSQIKKQGMN